MLDTDALPLRERTLGEVAFAFGARDGWLRAVRAAGGEWRGCLSLDIGRDGRYAAGRLAWRSFEDASTWELPRIVPGGGLEADWSFEGWEETADAVVARYRHGTLALAVRYRAVGRNAAVDAAFENLGPAAVYVNGVAFITSQPIGAAGVSFDFPGNVPYRVFDAAALADREPVETGLVNPVIRLNDGGARTNLIFMDEEEKWGTGAYRDGAALRLVNLAAVEAELAPGATLACGTLYVQTVGAGDPFAPIRELYAARGWTPPADGHRDGVLYACHPHGTMDADFPLRRGMAAFAEELPALRDMGVDHVWVLPIFEHLDRGVYHPTDQRIIDPRYGTDDDVARFGRKLHELGMTLLFDYVPHGPEPDDPLGKARREWASVRRNGELQIEWNCLSFDMANPDYLAYTKALVREHAERFGVDGARIDCAMGGLTNWRPYGANRPSNSNLKGGIAISRAIREGFIASGRKPLSMPENFNPVPAYAPVTDVFYDMALFRALYEMEEARLAPADFARELTRWLEAEHLSSVPGQVKLRFLGNHDTVTWVWNKARATAWYGEERAKALWVLLGCIDGMPMLYQGDEDAGICRKEGPELRGFFQELFGMRRRYFDNAMETDYVYTGTPVAAFWRGEGARRRFVAVNLSDGPAAFALPEAMADGALVYGAAELHGKQASLGAYGSAVWAFGEAASEGTAAAAEEPDFDPSPSALTRFNQPIKREG
ncbi:hypothetical protein I8J29_14040 [Paenibacillus sp. MWE-103]|uniref:Glycosyl hydrolase family 13 catalytic domain-containing protein n=1 Tax=Paenibacillus artemisiicola TaxID=1172618 RepID=A0ABS3WAL3_9BACL|nr:alpha-amylase family glycosyl hydrolase [Paenibacillus artemisiicola]MBO7745328.1 hypothetical protein [Paenibacillus artemisiicola]